MRVVVCGARGSTASSGPAFVRAGSHTSCLAVAHDHQVPSLVLDAGSGIREVTALLGGAPFRGAILLGHLHWDHVTGLPFFAGADRDGAETDLRLPDQGQDARMLLERLMSPPLFPIGPGRLRGTWHIGSFGEGTFEAAGFSVLAREIPHKGGRTMGLRVSDGRATLAYLSDHAPHDLGPGASGAGVVHEAALALADGVDLLVHDAQYTTAELPARGSFGHAAAEAAVELGVAAAARRLLLFHHDPPRTDDEIDALTERMRHLARDHRSSLRVDAAYAGMVIDL